MLPQLITSRQNDLYRFLKTLTEPRTRKKSGAFLLEGATFVEEVLEDEAQVILAIVLTPEFAETERGQGIVLKAHKKRIPVSLMAPALFNEIVATETPQGALAAVRQPHKGQIEGLKVPTVATVVVLEGLQDPSNVGAIIRIADAVGAFTVLYTKGTADPYAPKAVRASAGSLLHVPVVSVNSIGEAADWLKVNGFQIIAAVPQGGTNLFETQFAERVAVVVGNEARGLSPEALKVSDLLVTIPMIGKAESLNVAVATGIVLYEILRRRLI